MNRFLPKLKFSTLALTVACLFLVSGVLGQTNQSLTFTPGSGQRFVVPAGVTQLTIKVWGGGGGTAGYNYASSGGGGGGYAERTITVSEGQVINLNVGAGGAAVALSATAGNPGGATTVTTTDVNITAGGGGAGNSNTSNVNTPGGPGGISTGGDINKAGGKGGASGKDAGKPAGNDYRGGGGGGGGQAGCASGDGTAGSPGGDAVAPSGPNKGTVGPGGPGGTGGACETTGTGGNGGNGAIDNNKPGDPGGAGINVGAGAGGHGGGSTNGGSGNWGRSNAGGPGQVTLSWVCTGVNATDFKIASAAYNCSTNTATVTVSSTTLTTGVYTVYYDLSGANTASAQSATLTFTAGTPGTGTFSVPLTNTGATTLRIIYVGCAVVSSNNTATLTNTTTTWTGSADISWSNADNWTCGVPTAGTDAVIPVASQYPTIASGVTGDVRHLTLNSNGSDVSLTVLGNLQLTGNLTRTAGVIVATAGTVSFNGSSAQSVPVGTFSGTIGNLIINNTTGVTLNNNSTITGNLTLTAGTLTMAGGSVLTITDGGSVERKEGSFSGSLRYGTGAGVDVSYTGSTSIASGASSTPLLTPSTGKVRNLIINLSDNTRSVNTSTGSEITVAGNLTITSGTLALGNNLSVGGNWSRASAAGFTSNGKIVTFNGTAAQAITVTGGTASFTNLVINNAAGVFLGATTDVNVSSSLALTLGPVVTNANKIIIAQGGAVSRTQGWVAGYLQKWISGAGSVEFEIGGPVEIGMPATYRPVTVNFSSVTTPGNLIAFVTQMAGDHPDLENSGIITARSVNRYYSLTPAGLVISGTYTATFEYVSEDVDDIANPSNFVVLRYNGTNWPMVASTVLSPTSIQGTFGALTAINEFAIGECSKPSVSSLATSAVPACSNNSAVITVSSTSLTNGTTYDVIYKLEGDNNATSVSASFTLSGGKGTFTTTPLANSGSTIITITSIKEAGTPGCSSFPASGNTATITVNDNTWTGGANSTVWTNASNWSCGVVPTVTDNVVIPSGKTKYPDITGLNNGVRNLTIESGARVTVQSLSKLQISGTVTNNGTFDVTAGAVEFNGSTAQTIPANVFSGNTVLDLIISNNVSLGGVLNLTGTLLFSGSNKTFTTNNHLTLKSTEAATARVADLTNNSLVSGNKITGNVTVERYVPAKESRRWTLITAPVYGNTIRQGWQDDVFITGPGTGGQICGTGTGNGGATDRYNSNGFDVTRTNNPSMYQYKEATVNNSHWVSVPNTTTMLQPGAGYLMNLRGQRGNCADQLNSNNPAPPAALTLRATGTPFQGDTAIALNNLATHPFTLIGNPYPSQIDFKQLQLGNSTVIHDKLWVYSPQENLTNIYSTYAQGVEVNNPSRNPALTLIASGQAFFVEAKVDGSVSFKEQHKTDAIQSGNTMFRTMVWMEKIRVKYTDAGDKHLDEIVVRFGDDPAITTNVNMYDAASLNSGTFIASRKGTSRFAIQTRPIGFTTDTVALTVTATTAGTYKLQFSEYENIVSAPVIELLDAYTGTVTDIKAQNSYAFSIDGNAASKGDGRFKVVFKKGTSLPVRSINLTAEHQQNKVQLNWTVAGEQNMHRYGVERSGDGQSFQSIGSVAATANNNNTALYAYTDQQPLAGTAYYRIQAQGRGGEVRYSAIVKVQQGSKVSVELYPNPVKDRLNLVVLNGGAGRYELQVLNMHGAEVMRRGGILVQNGAITLDTKSLSAGMYTLRLSSAGGEIITQMFVKQ